MDSAAIKDFLDALPMPAIAIDGTERIVSSNTQARSLVGQGIEGRNYVAILRQPALIETVDAVLSDSKPRAAQYLGNDGARDTVFQVTARAVTSENFVLLCFIDTTDLQQAGQMRRDFVANVSHELRTPLTALIGFIETLRGPARDDAAARDRFLDIMDGEAGRMNRLVGDLLSLSRVEGDERVRPKEQMELRGVILSVMRTLKPLADEAGVRMNWQGPDDEIAMIGDPDQLQQVFTNLIENAIKYGAAGQVVDVSVSRSDRDPSLRAAGVRVSVIDDGPGIDPVHLPRLTERFYRADSHRSRALGGTGLGLAIVKAIINRHRGRLQVESELGHGAQFTVILPIEQT